MKFNRNHYILFASALMLGALNQSCSADDPFVSDQNGEGDVMMKMQVNSELTRAELSQEEENLRQNCVLYVSKGQTLLYKYKGLENVPDRLRLKNGSYLAEAWTGDSVSASFDKKFYYGKEPFEIGTGDVKSVTITCGIANVAVSINPATVQPELMKEWTITVFNSRGSLDFTAENMDDAKGYFMMPQADMVKDAEGNFLRDEKGNIYYTNLRYTIKGKRADGGDFEKSGIICKDGAENKYVQRAHEYVLNLKYDPNYEQTGGAFVDIVVDDTQTEINSEVNLYSRPAIKGVGFDIDRQIVGDAGGFKEQILKVTAFGSIENMVLSSADNELFKVNAGAGTDLMLATEDVKASLRAAGYEWDYVYNEQRNLATSYLHLGAALLNSLPKRDSEYLLGLKVTDKYGKENMVNVRIAVGEGAVVIDDPVTVTEINRDNDLLAIGATRATLPVSLASADVVNPAIQYRKQGTETWSSAPVTVGASGTRAVISCTAVLTGLEPGTVYEYRAAAEGFESKDVYVFETESKFIIPGNSFEEWSTYSAKTLLGTKQIPLPWSVGDKEASFWGSGNEGSATANATLTDKSTDMKHSGTYSARMESKKIVGKMAAGNLFVGHYAKTDGTDGVLSLGRTYNGSHPTKLSVWANYRPGSGVDVPSGIDQYVPNDFKGGIDHGQIYVALTTEPVEIRTKSSNRKLFNPDDACVVAYGQVTWTGNFGPDGQLQQLEIPLEYKAKAKTTKPLYMVIVCSASKYGDYFSGSAGSTMYLDDFEFVYE